MNKQLQEKAASDTTLQEIKNDRYPIGYLMIQKRICFSNNSEQHPIRLFFLSTRHLYNIRQYTNKNTTEYFIRFRKDQKVNEAYNGILITKEIQEHGMKILFLLQNTEFDSLKEDDKKELEKSGKKMLCAILYLDTSEKSRFSDLKKCVENEYVMNKAEHPRTLTAVQSLLINYQPNYKTNRNP